MISYTVLEDVFIFQEATAASPRPESTCPALSPPPGFCRTACSIQSPGPLLTAPLLSSRTLSLDVPGVPLNMREKLKAETASHSPLPPAYSGASKSTHRKAWDSRLTPEAGSLSTGGEGVADNVAAPQLLPKPAC